MVVRDWGEAFLRAVSDAFSKLFSFLPDLIGAVIILFIGWFIAGLLGRLTADVLRKIRFNQAAEKAGLSRFVQSAGIKKDASGVMGEIVKWFFRIIALVAAFSVLQLPALTAALTGILNFIPNLAVALVIILIGSLIANFASDFLKGALTQAGFGNAGMFANIARYAILYIAVVAALGQIGVAETVINTLWIGTVAALALALGLAFGLGGRDTASRLLENAYTKTQENLPKMSQAIKQKAQQDKQPQQQLPSRGNAPAFTPGYGYAASGQTEGNYAQPTSSQGGYVPSSNQQGGYVPQGDGYQAQGGGYTEPTPPQRGYYQPQQGQGQQGRSQGGQGEYRQYDNTQSFGDSYPQ